MICLNPSRIYFHYKGKGLYVVKNVFCTGMGGGTHEHAADWDTGGGRSSAGTSVQKREIGIWHLYQYRSWHADASLLGKISLLKDVLNEVSNVVGLNSDYFKTLWKILGVTYAAEFSSAICKDAGYQTIALQIEVFAKITILVLSLPVLSALLQTIRGFLV